MSLDQYPPWPDLLRWLTAVKDRVESVVAIGTEQVITGEFDPSLIPPIPWDRVLKTDSSLGDLETRSASDLSSGTVPAGRMPALTGDVSSVAGNVATTLATVNSTPGTYGSGTSVPLVSVNEKGLVTAVLEQPIANGALTRVDDTNITLTLGGSPLTALLQAVSLTLGWAGLLSLARGGTNADLSATGGAAQYLKQAGAGAAVTVGTIPASDIASPAALTRVDDTNVTLTLGGTPATSLLAAVSLTLGWTGALSVARGGIGTATALAVSVVVASGRLTAQVAAVASVAAYTVGGSDESLAISANVNVTTSTLHSFSVQVDYTDETNTAQTLTLTFSQLSAALVSTITNATGAGPYEGLPVHLRCKAATTVTVKTTGTFTTVTYNVEAVITKLV